MCAIFIMNPKQRKIIITTFITFTLFMLEAISHWNIGKNYEKESIVIKFPPFKELLKIAAIVMAVSALNGFLVERFAK